MSFSKEQFYLQNKMMKMMSEEREWNEVYFYVTGENLRGVITSIKKKLRFHGKIRYPLVAPKSNLLKSHS